MVASTNGHGIVGADAGADADAASGGCDDGTPSSDRIVLSFADFVGIGSIMVVAVVLLLLVFVFDCTVSSVF